MRERGGEGVDMEDGETGKGRGVEGRGEDRHAWGVVLVTSVYNCWNALIFWQIFGLAMVVPLISFPLQRNVPNLHRGLEDFPIFSCTVSASLWVFIFSSYFFHLSAQPQYRLYFWLHLILQFLILSFFSQLLSLFIVIVFYLFIELLAPRWQRLCHIFVFYIQSTWFSLGHVKVLGAAVNVLRKRTTGRV